MTAELFPSSPERVLREMPKPPVKPSSSADLQNIVSLTPVTPVTPVTVEASTSLHNLIKEHACAAACDEACRQPQ
jgi:hypothetical protein